MYGVSFRGAMDSARDILSAPQANSRPQTATVSNPATVEVPKKKSKLGKIILGTVAAAAVVIGGLAAGKHFGIFDKVVNWAGKADTSKFLGKMQSWAGKAGEAMNTAGGKIMEWGTAAYKTLTVWFGKGQS